jgi:magnesium-transporting ATPase (P-type)
MVVEYKGILTEIEEFLEYLAKNYNNHEKRKEEDLSKKFGTEKLNRVISICMDEGYTRRDVIQKENKRYYESRITTIGLKFLEEHQKGRREEKRANQQTYLTASLFTVAFLQAAISIIYSFFDLQFRKSPNSTTFLLVSITGTIAFFIILIYNFSKKKFFFLPHNP